MKLLVDAPLNSLSFGNVSYNFIRSLKNKNVEIGLFPVSDKVDLRAFKVPSDISDYIKDSIEKRFDFLKEEIPTLRMWHLNGSENRKNSRQFLYTFYECNQPTERELAIAKAQTHTFFSSTYSNDHFKTNGVENCSYVPIGFDPDFHITDKKYLEGITHFGLMGKFEKRKNTAKIIKTWLKKYGNDNRYQLSCCVTNPFFKPEQMQQILNSVLDGQRYTNINFLPYLETNAEVNDFLNAIDIDLTGLSGGEGWNIPAFNSTALGKWSVVLYETSHKDWANTQNSILVESSGEFDSHDQVFFQKGSPFNQGTFYDFSEDDAICGMEEAVKKVGQINTEGQKLSDKFSYDKTIDAILARIFNT